MLYKKAIDGDIPRLVEFRKILLEHEDDKSLDDVLSDYFHTSLRDKSLVAWVAEDDELIVSTVCLSVCQLVPGFNNPTGKIAYMTTVYTVPEYRRRGIATNLIRQAVADVKAQGIKKILLHSSDMARSVYEGLGFAEGENFFVLNL